MALASQQRHSSSLPQKRLPEEPCASTPCVQPVNPIPAPHSRCHVPLRDNHVYALCYTKCLVCQRCVCHWYRVLDLIKRAQFRCGLARCRQEGCIVLCC